MIAGQIVVEDHTVQFRWNGNGQVEFTACDNLTGKQYGMCCTPHQFVMALFLALHPEPDSYPTDFWAAAGCCMPEEKTLRWIP